MYKCSLLGLSLLFGVACSKPNLYSHLDQGTSLPYGDGGSGFVDLGGAECGQATVSAIRIRPNVMLLLDRSDSMNNPIADSDPNGSRSPPSKWDILKTALQSVVTQFDSQLRFGVAVFPTLPSPNTCGTALCCMPTAIGVACGDNRGSAVLDVVKHTVPSGETPTAASLRVVQESTILSDPTRPNYLVLATDGLPNCDPADQTDGSVSAQVITELYNMSPSVKTFVIGMGKEVHEANPAILNRWAEAGHTALSGAIEYYQPNSADELNQAFAAIAQSTVSCSYALSERAPDPTQIAVSIDQVPVPADTANGFTYDGAGPTLTFHGAACESLLINPGSKIQVRFECSGAVR